VKKDNSPCNLEGVAATESHDDISKNLSVTRVTLTLPNPNVKGCPLIVALRARRTSFGNGPPRRIFEPSLVVSHDEELSP
jgi:hypothetical protein